MMSRDETVLKKNVGALAFSQLINFFIPLLAIPFLARTLSKDSFGEVVWVQTLMMLGAVIVDYGFNWTVTKEIAEKKSDKDFVSNVASAVLTIQFLISLIFLCFVVIFTYILHPTATEMVVVGWLILLGQIFTPVWLFQGLEKLVDFSLIQVLGKIITFPLLFIMVTSDDKLGAIAYFAISSILTGVICIYWIKRKILFKFSLPKQSMIADTMKAGWNIFLSRVFITLYTLSIPLGLGYWAGPEQLAYFNIADRFKSALLHAITPITAAFFPRVSSIIRDDRQKAVILLKKELVILQVITGFIGGFVFVFSYELVIFLGGVNYAASSEILKWMSFVPLIVCISNVYGVQIMIIIGKQQQFAAIVGSASILCLLLIHFLINRYGGVGAAMLIVVVEIYTSILMFYFIVKKNKFFDKKVISL